MLFLLPVIMGGLLVAVAVRRLVQTLTRTPRLTPALAVDVAPLAASVLLLTV